MNMEIIRAKKAKLSMDLAPLIDVVFQLLVFFMLTSTFANPAIQMTLPKAKTSEIFKQEQLVISVDQNGNVFLNQEKSSLVTLKSDLGRLLKETGTTSVHIKGDQDMPYKRFVYIMSIAKEAGAQQINIVHQKDQ
jgi:biopolymer transport protein ExbD